MMHIQQGNPEHGAIGRDQRKVDSEHLKQPWTSGPNDLLGELNDGCDHHDKDDRSKIADAQGFQNGLIDQVAEDRGEGQHEDGGKA